MSKETKQNNEPNDDPATEAFMILAASVLRGIISHDAALAGSIRRELNYQIELRGDRLAAETRERLDRLRLSSGL